ncbi:MAG: hypothetical protein BJ554DRAFT_6259 [Olpidium bornovanus]|uniref:Uncharacterized protein n=1 Tax=Olpidium bornovanus TaxID=278681 RepID=A0A8H7ZY61_9FUNG|nr:MAG: hypothetical protein BJ554DRAFT_6259 [Olpidium bornovanus]
MTITKRNGNCRRTAAQHHSRLRRLVGRLVVVLDTMIPSISHSAATVAMSVISASERSGAIFTSNGGRSSILFRVATTCGRRTRARTSRTERASKRRVPPHCK